MHDSDGRPTPEDAELDPRRAEREDRETMARAVRRWVRRWRTCVHSNPDGSVRKKHPKGPVAKMAVQLLEVLGVPAYDISVYTGERDGCCDEE